MPKQLSVPAEWDAASQGEVAALAQQLGPAAITAWGAVPVFTERIEDKRSLCQCLQRYQAEVLVAAELPAILQAFRHAMRHEVRELIDLDLRLASSRISAELASASQRVGRRYLRRLRPLRDERLVQRYLQAVESGRAHGWHTLVYGLALHIYSLPLRQGLAAYASQTLRGFLNSAGPGVRLPPPEADQILADLMAPVPGSIEALLANRALAALP